MNSQLINLIASSWTDLTGSFTLNQLQIFLLIGTSVLAIALMLLTLTRWGHARPIWKCVFLSIGAHVLLITYAYGTHLISKVPPTAQRDSGIKITILDEPASGDDVKEEGNPEQKEEAPWNSFGSILSPPRSDSSFSLTTTVPDSREIDVPERLKSSFQPEFTPSQTEFAPPLQQPAADLAQRNETPEPFELPDLGSEIEFSAEVDSQVADIVEPIPQATIDPEKFESFDSELKSGLVQAQPQVQAEADDQPEPVDVSEMTPALVANEDVSGNPVTELIAEPSVAEPTLEESENKTLAESKGEQIAAAESGPPSAAEAEPVPAANQIPKSSVGEKNAMTGNESVASKTTAPIVGTRKLVAQPTSAGNATKRIADGQKMPTLYQARTDGSKLEAAKKRGGSDATEEAVERALKWLAQQQEADGRWNPRLSEGGVERMVLGHNRQGAGANADAGITSLAVLAFLAHGHTHLEGDYRETVQHGLEFLIRNQQYNGDLAGNASFFARTYCHSMALLAICEALAITGDQRLKPAAQRAVDFTVKMQNPNDGGWRYRYGDAGDMSQFGWIVLALHSAELGGLNVPQQTRVKMKSFLDACTRGRHGGLASYRPREEITDSMTAEAFVCRNFLEKEVHPRTRSEAADRIITNLPNAKNVNLYYWYYGTLAMYNAGGDYWEKWNAALTRTLVSSQVTEGRMSGSWEPNGLWAGYGGRVYSTAMSTLCLEVYYRYLPMFEVAELEGVQSPLRNARNSRRLR